MSKPSSPPSQPPLRLLSVVIPARDEEGNIAGTVEHLHVELRLRGIEHEIVVVDGVLSASLRSGAGSEAVALRHPVMPIANGLGCGFVGIDGSQLR